MIDGMIKYCDKCGEETIHAVSVIPQPDQCPYCSKCCEEERDNEFSTSAPSPGGFRTHVAEVETDYKGGGSFL